LVFLAHTVAQFEHRIINDKVGILVRPKGPRRMARDNEASHVGGSPVLKRGGCRMSYQRAELRAYPRLSWANPAQLRTPGATQPAQVVDLSLGGCKLMPSDLVALIESGLRPGATVHVEIGGMSLEGCVRWATPNCSALGCAFDVHLTEADLAALGIKASAAASSRPTPPRMSAARGRELLAS
jgi:hypothetical protein